MITSITKFECIPVGYTQIDMQCLKEIGVVASCLTKHHMMFPLGKVHHFSFCYARNIVAVVPAQSTVPKKMATSTFTHSS